MSYLFPSATITFDAALRDLAQGSPKARARAAYALGDIEGDAERHRAVDALVRALEDDVPAVRMEACVSLGELRDAAAVPQLVRRLDDGAAPVRQNAAIALGSIAHPDAFDPLAAALAEGPADLRFQAATSLAEVDPVRAFAPLAAALGDKDPQVAAAAALGLGAIGDARAVPLLLPLLDHREGATRFDAAYALAELGDASGREQLASMFGDAERAWDAVTALGKVGGTASALLLGTAMAAKGTPVEATVLAAGTVLAIDANGPAHDAARRVLVAALTARKVHVRGIAVEQLAIVGGAWAKEPLEKLARSGKGVELLEAIATSLRAINEREP